MILIVFIRMWIPYPVYFFDSKNGGFHQQNRPVQMVANNPACNQQSTLNESIRFVCDSGRLEPSIKQNKNY